MSGVEFLTFDAHGEIASVGTCNAPDLPKQCDGGRVLQAPPGVSAATHWVDDGQLVAYTDAQRAEKAARPLRALRWDNGAMAWETQGVPPEAVAAAARAERDRRLAACDWVVTRAAERGERVPPEWLAYRQALRDLTLQPGFPGDVVWPIPPGSAARRLTVIERVKGTNEHDDLECVDLAGESHCRR